MDVSIIIVCMNRPDNLRPCLDSVIRTTTVDYEIIVVAYLFDKAELQVLRVEYPQVRFIVNDAVAGFSENNNLALKYAKGRFCFVVNDDTEIGCPLVDTLVKDFDVLPQDTAIVSPTILNADGSIQLNGRPDYTPSRFVAECWHMYRAPKDDTAGKTPVEGHASIFRTSNICGAAFLIRTEVFEELGWFDERYFFTPEDIALSTMARRKGYSIYVDTSVSIVHKWHATASSLSAATKPASMRGFLIFLSGDNQLRYLFLAVPVWLAESAKLLKTSVSYVLSRTEGKRIEIRYLRNNLKSIFTRKSAKEIFLHYFKAL